MPALWFNQGVNTLSAWLHRHAADLAALVLASASFFSTAWAASNIFENLPHLEDEMAYVWEAKAAAGGTVRVVAPECTRCFLYPFVIDYNGWRFGKYPLGWPAALSLGIRLGVRGLVNPLLGAACLWLTYRLGKKLFHPGIGLLAAFLTGVSPFFIMNTASLLSHTWGLFLTLVLVAGWVDTFSPRYRQTGVPAALTAACAGLALGLLALSRPLTAAAVGLPFAMHGLVILIRGKAWQKRAAIGIGLAAGLIASLHFIWQYAVTGDFLLNPYTLWWSYDRVGFGPGHGLQDDGYSLLGAFVNTRFSLGVLAADTFGWFKLSLIFIPFGIWTGRRSAPAWLILALFPSIVLAYGLYWITSWLFGPRYYFECMPALTLFTAMGAAWLAGLYPVRKRQSLQETRRRAFAWFARPVLLTLAISLLVSASLLYYLPQRLQAFRGLYRVKAEYVQPFLRPEVQSLEPALIIVHKQHTWYEYGTLLDLETPFLDTPLVFVYDPTPEEEKAVIARFPGRAVYHYYHDDPWRLYAARRE